MHARMHAYAHTTFMYDKYIEYCLEGIYVLKIELKFEFKEKSYCILNEK